MSSIGGGLHGRPTRAAAALGLGILLVAATPAASRAQASAASERRVVDRAERLRDAGRPSDASLALREHLGRVPGALDALALLGEIAIETGEAAELLPFAEAAVTAAPGEVVARQWWVRALIGNGRADSAAAVTARWLDTSPEIPAARLAHADVQLAVGDTARAIRSLQEAPAPVPSEILVRLSDLLFATGATDDLIASWVGLLGLDPPHTDAVVADLRGAGIDQVMLLERLLAEVRDQTGSSPRAGSFVALRLGHAASARQVAEIARGAGDVEDAAFLREYVREAQEAGLPGEIAWAARHLVVLSPRPVDRWRWQALAADQSLAAGDTGSARQTFVELARESEPGEGPHQIASQRLFALLAADPDALEDAADLLTRYATEYPDSSRATAAMSGQLAIGHARADDLPAAHRVLSEARGRLPPAAAGPLDAAGARLALFAGQIDSARVRAGRSILEPGLEAGERTRRLGLMTLLQAADSAEFRVVGTAAHELLMPSVAFDPGPTLRALAGLPGSAGRPTVLAFLADMAAEAGRHEIAAAVRQQVVSRHPASPEAPEALLDLARSARPDEAGAWLEQLIVGYPESALAPIARRMLTDLEGRKDGT